MTEPPTPDDLRDRVRSLWSGGDLWLFAYASLIWRPEFEADEQRAATLFGCHRALRMRSRIDRGTAQQPGLVFALLRGGSCGGVAYRIEAARAGTIFDQVWEREMPTLVYTPRWLNCRTPQGPVRALTFTLERDNPSYTGVLDDGALLEILRHARGRYGSTLDYLLHTARCLRERGIRDAEVERMVHVAHRNGLLNTQRSGGAGPMPAAAESRLRSSSVSMSNNTPTSETSTPKAG